MAHSGAPDITVTAGDFTVAIIAASWHTEVMDGLIAGAERAAADAGAQTTLIRVPGSFELAVAAARVAKHFDAVVALGVVIRGGTPHFDYVCSAATDGLNRLFSNDALQVRLARDLGLGLVDRLPGLKRLFIREAAGLRGRQPRLMRGEAL